MANNIHFRTLRLKPHWTQFIINEFPLIALLSACLIIRGVESGMEYILIKRIILYVSCGLLLFLLYRMMHLASITYMITGEQLIFQHGVINHTTEYMELYRIVDYQQKKSFVQQVFGLKTVIIMSGDKTLPQLNIIGVKDSEEVVAEIRNRVEYNKKRRGVYEITNRF